MPKKIQPTNQQKVNVKASLEFEPGYYDVTQPSTPAITVGEFSKHK